MQMKNKLYPYPVIAQGNDSYLGSTFATDADCSIDAYTIVFSFKAVLNDSLLSDYLKAGKVKFAHHIECQQTCYRTVVFSDEAETSFRIHSGKINGQVQICSLLVAVCDLKGYSNPSFGPDYRGFRFDIEKGCVLAIGSQVNFEIDKENEDLANASSIFAIRKNYDPAAFGMQVSTTGQKIVVVLPEIACNQYHTLSASENLPVLHSMIILPALMQVLFELKEAAQKNELYIYENYRWFRSIKKAASKISIPFTEEAVASSDVLDTAQKLIDAPEIRALNFICSGQEE